MKADPEKIPRLVCAVHKATDARSQMHTVRQDTFEVIEPRAMYESEKQVALFPVEGGKKIDTLLRDKAAAKAAGA